MAWVRVKRKTSIDAPRLLASALRFSGINSPSGSREQARLKRKSGAALGEPPPPSAHHSAYRARLNGGSTLSLGSLSEISPLLGISHQAETSIRQTDARPRGSAFGIVRPLLFGVEPMST